jgi:peptidoglycan/LPS O-acetylase OafA/YrhL
MSESAARPWPRATMRLGDCTAGRDNNMQLLRVLAASAVLLFHCYALTGHRTDEPLWRAATPLNLGALGVQVFFVISGFLVTQSWLTRERVAPFVVTRALRIYPALVAATLATLALAAWSSALPAARFWRDPQALDYVLHTPLGFAVRHFLPGAYAGNPGANAVNGSLYTLPFELRLYVAVALAGAAGVLARRSVALVAIIAILAIGLARPDWIDRIFDAGADQHVGTLALLFALGMLAFLWRDAIPMSPVSALAALAAIAVDPAGLARTLLFAPLLVYLVLIFAYDPRLRWRAYNRVGDYSYGMHVYAFPTQQTLIERMPGIAPPALFALALPITHALAVVSWHALEHPLLGLKSPFRRPVPSS